jgi:hypothetical protein
MAFALVSFDIAVDGYLSPQNVTKLGTFGEIEFEPPEDEYIPNMSERALKLLIEQFDADTIFD